MNTTSELRGGPETVRTMSRWWLLSCVLLALSLRGFVIATHSDELTRDRDAYLGMARCLAEGRGLVDPERLIPTAFRPPVYPIQLGGLMLFLPAAVAVAVGNLIWGGITVWATWRAGVALGLGEQRSLLAALLVAVDPMLLQYSAQPMTEVTCAGLASLLVFWIVRRDCPEAVRQLGIGLLFGLLVLCRPTFWPFAGLILCVWVLQKLLLKEPTPAAAVSWRVIVSALLVLVPWVVRNQMVMGSPILMTTHGGYTILLANNPEFYSEVVDRGWGSEWSKPSFDRWTKGLLASMRDELGPDSTEMDRDRWQGLQARRFIWNEPERFAQAVWYRIRSLWSPAPQGEASGSTPSRLVWLVGCYYTAVLGIFAISVVLTMYRLCQRKEFSWWPLLALVLTVQGVHLVYWTNARMRAPIVPVISLFVFRRSQPSPTPSK